MLGIRQLPIGDEDEVIDLTDRVVLFTHIMEQAVDDYVKLAYPLTRVKKYLQEHYLNAIDFLFDPEYRLAYVDDDDERPMPVEELISIVSDGARNQMKQLQDYAIQSSIKYWKEKPMSPLESIPETIVIEGITFDIHHAYIRKYAVDLESRTITLDKGNPKAKKINLALHENFLEAVLYTTCLIKDLSIKVGDLKALSSSMFQTLKVNASFSNVKIPSMEELYKDIELDADLE